MGTSWAERLDGLRDRFTLRAMVAAGVALAALLVLTIYGGVVLGTRVLLPTLAFVPLWAALLAIVLWMPWEWGGVEPRQPLGRWWGYWEGWVVYGSLIGLARLHGDYLFHLGEALDGSDSRFSNSWPSAERAERLRAFRDDVFGGALVADAGWLPLVLGAGLLLLAWWLLR